jgi:proline dehydrogenase
MLGTPRAQRALVNRASQNATDLAGRQAAAAAFAAAVALRGTLLTTAEIEQQYDRYNESEHLDTETQAVLGSLLDAIEKRARDVQAGLQPK